MVDTRRRPRECVHLCTLGGVASSLIQEGFTCVELDGWLRLWRHRTRGTRGQRHHADALTATSSGTRHVGRMEWGSTMRGAIRARAFALARYPCGVFCRGLIDDRQYSLGVIDAIRGAESDARTRIVSRLDGLARSQSPRGGTRWRRGRHHRDQDHHRGTGRGDWTPCDSYDWPGALDYWARPQVVERGGDSIVGGLKSFESVLGVACEHDCVRTRGAGWFGRSSLG